MHFQVIHRGQKSPKSRARGTDFRGSIKSLKLSLCNDTSSNYELNYAVGSLLCKYFTDKIPTTLNFARYTAKFRIVDMVVCANRKKKRKFLQHCKFIEEQNLRCSQQHCWTFRSSMMLRRVNYLDGTAASKALHFFETSVFFSQAIGCNIPEDLTLKFVSFHF